MIRITFLSENKTETPFCQGEHGLSIYIEAHGRKILFDLGASDLFYENAKRLNIDIEEVDLAVVSHGHYDHTGGIPKFCKVNKSAPIYIHKNAFRQTYGMENGELDTRGNGIPFNKDEYLHRFILTDGFTRLSDDIVISGTIPRTEGIGSTETFYMKREDGTLLPDDMSHEQFLAIRDEKGIFLFNGCSHREVVSAVTYCRKIFPNAPIFMLIAGMHMYHASEEEREGMVTNLRELGIENVMPVHCTGLSTIAALKNSLGDNCILATAGATYEY